MENLDVTKIILVFLATAISDVLWTFYIRRTGQGKALAASSFTFLIALLGGIAVVTYVENPWYLVPTAFGAFIGTFISIKWDVKGKKTEQ
ncbi:MAG: hypothetical protein QMD65_02365 [Patescibacteria group bacterium]|nr:hypothetical protein [Patescibacteria group bacterium]